MKCTIQFKSPKHIEIPINKHKQFHSSSRDFFRCFPFVFYFQFSFPRYLIFFPFIFQKANVYDEALYSRRKYFYFPPSFSRKTLQKDYLRSNEFDGVRLPQIASSASHAAVPIGIYVIGKYQNDLFTWASRRKAAKKSIT